MSQIAVTNGVTVRSVNGADYTVVKQAAGYPVVAPYDSEDRLVLLKHAEAVFDGFSITKATLGPVYIDGAGILKDCIVSNNVTQRAVTDGGGVFLNYGGVVTNCQIINNRVYTTGGSGRDGGGIYMNSGGLVDSCVITNNSIDYGIGTNTRGGGVFMNGSACILRNSLIAQNFCQVKVGGVYCLNGTNTTGLYYAWSFNNDETVDVAGLGREVVTNLYWPGLYAVRLTVSNAIGEVDTIVREQYIKVAPAVAYVTTNGASAYPYDTWATAATNIQDALDAGLDGMLVLVSNGVYGITSRIDMPLNITLRSVNGAEKTEIRRIGGTVGIFYLTAPEAVVDGFTIVNALDAAVYLDYGGVVSNCVIRDNNIPGSGGYGGGVLMTGGWLKHCQIINNTRTSTGGGGTRGCGISMSGAAVVESCIIANNNTSTGWGSAGAGGGVYMTGGTLRNSLIFGNGHNITAGGVYASGGTIESCTIVSNATPAATGVGGLYNSGRTIQNSIIQFNTSTNVLSNYGNAGAATYYNCSTYPTNGLTGSANLDDDPLFKNVALGDCRLATGSPCINAGTNQLWMAGTVDLAGQPRILNKLVDIGAYEGRLPGGTLLILQ